MTERGVILAAQGDWIECRGLFPNFVFPDVDRFAIARTGALANRGHEPEGVSCDQILDSGTTLVDVENMMPRQAVACCKGNRVNESAHAQRYDAAPGLPSRRFAAR